MLFFEKIADVLFCGKKNQKTQYWREIFIKWYTAFVDGSNYLNQEAKKIYRKESYFTRITLFFIS